jgi:hypothetical protein
VVAARVEVEETPLVEEPVEPEVIKEGKTDEEDE